MVDRSTNIPGNQIEDDSLKQDELDLTNTPTDTQIIQINMPAGDFTAIDLGDIGDINTMQTNIVLNAFRIAINGSLSQFNMVDGIVDEYEDELAIDTANSINELYDAVNDLYSPSGGLASSEYASDANTVLLLHCNGSDASTTFTDDGDTGHTVTANGNAQIDTAQQKFGTGSGLFDGTGDYLSIPDSTDWNWGNGDFTWDFWVRGSVTGASMGLIGGQSHGGGNLASAMFGILSSDKFSFIAHDATTAEIANYTTTSTVTIADGTWHHIALVRSGTSILMFLDGVSLALDENVAIGTSSLVDSTDTFNIGCRHTQTFCWDGWMDEIRLSKGIARFTSDFDTQNNMTLISDVFTAEAVPTNARIVLFEEDVDSVTLNTDLKAFATRDAGQTFTTDFATDDKLDITSHGFSNDDRIMVASSSQDLPAGLDSATVYYVINATTNDFELSLTSSGSAVDITDDGTGTHTAKQVSEITLANDGEYESGKNILTGSIDISGQTSGTSMEYQLVTANDKNLKIHGTGLSWD